MFELAPGERIEWSAPPDLAGVQVLLVDNCARRWQLFHETYTTCTGLAISEPADWRYRGKVHSQPANGLSLMEPGEMHANTRITKPASFRVLTIDPAEMQKAAERLGLPARPHLKVAQIQGGPIHRAFVRLHRSLESEATPLERQSFFDHCLTLLLTHCTEWQEGGRFRPSDHAAVQRARAFIESQHAERISLDHVVAAAGAVSRFHLAHAFAREVGVPPHAYQIHVRIARARKLLLGGMAPTEVAAALGFADQSHFTRHFRRVTGVTPSRYGAGRAARRSARTK